MKKIKKNQIYNKYLKSKIYRKVTETFHGQNKHSTEDEFS